MNLLHNFKDNLAFASGEKYPGQDKAADWAYSMFFNGLSHIKRTNYNTPEGKAKEKRGTDIEIYTESEMNILQEKWRSEVWWGNRYKDIYVELENEYRGGPGWFYEYEGNIDYLVYPFIKDTNLSEINFLMYNSRFFAEVRSLMSKGLYSIPGPHKQISRGIIGGKTSGIVIEQRYLHLSLFGRQHYKRSN